MNLQFPLEIAYGQVTVFRHGLSRPGLLWDDDHVTQGFAWDKDTVSFGVTDHDGSCWVDVALTDHIELFPDAISAVSVPFEAKTDRIDIGTVGTAEIFTLPPGSYSIIFQTRPGRKIEDENYAYLFSIRFALDRDPQFRILRQGGEIQTDHVLRQDAVRA